MHQIYEKEWAAEAAAICPGESALEAVQSLVSCS